MNAPAQLDNLNRAREDEDMDNANDTLRSEMGNGFRETNVRIDIMYRESNQRMDALHRLVDESIAELRRDTTENITELRRQTTENITEFRKEVNERIVELRREVNARVDRLEDRLEAQRRETQENFRLIEAKIDQVRSNVDVHFRWLVGLMLTSMLGIATLLVKVI